MELPGNRNLWDIMGIERPSGEGDIPTSSNGDLPLACRICGAVENQQCNGSGFYDVDVPVGHPDFSKVFRCPNNPLEHDNARKDTLRRLSNLGSYSDANFDNFDLGQKGMSDNAYQSLRLAHSTALRFAENPAGKWIVFEGTYVSGKTHLAAAIGNERLENGEMVLFITAPDLLDHLRSAYGRDAEASYSETFDRVRRADLLILDDLGVENPSEWSKEKLFQLLNHRYSERLPTVITTNTDIDKLDPRLRSRMLDMNVVQHVRITAPDYRSIHTNAQERLSDLHLYGEYQFDNFDLRSGCYPQETQNLQRVIYGAQEYAQQAVGWMLIKGDSGTGKTHLAAAIANHWQFNGGEVMLVSAPDLLDYLRRTFNPNSNLSFDEQFNQVKETPMLVLDDLGAVDHNKAWVREKLIQIIKYRYLLRLTTLITTSTQIEDMDGQIATRLIDQRMCRSFEITARPYAVRLRRGTGG
ncbi:MAG: ATP-binding protein [Chloroflexota bacterium]